MDIITHARVEYANGSYEVVVRINGGASQMLFWFFHEDMNFKGSDFIGLTWDQAKALKKKADLQLLGREAEFPAFGWWKKK